MFSKCMRLYQADASTGLIDIKYVCNVCGKELDEFPKHWRCRVAGYSSVPDISTFQCWCSKECEYKDPERHGSE